MLTREKAIKILKAKNGILKQQYHIKRIGLFGSLARGELKKDSDVDLFIEFNKFVGFKFINLSDYLEKLFNRKVDILTPLGIKSIRVKHIADSIRKNIIYV